MNEAKVMLFLKKFYDALQVLEELKDEAFETYCKEDLRYIDDRDPYFFLTDVYDELFEWTNVIEEFFGIIEE